MKQALATQTFFTDKLAAIRGARYVLLFLAGLSAPLGFAPFHIPGLTLLSLALFFYTILPSSPKQSLLSGFIYGMGFFGCGVSWVIVSIHDYGQLHYVLAALVTLLFLCYLAFYPAMVGWVFSYCRVSNKPLRSAVAFATLWCLSEYLRATCMTGFPWLLIGTSQLDTPLKYLTPVLGIYGVGFMAVFAACLLSLALRARKLRQYYYLWAFVLIIISPSLLKNVQWVQVQDQAVQVAAVQGNLSMRDKWDDHLFWQVLQYYGKTTRELLGNKLVILPESAIPLPASYLEDYLLDLHKDTLAANSALLLGILQPKDESEKQYYNTITAYGRAEGQHVKRHLVPFGEYIPKPFVALNKWLNLPEPNIMPGKAHQALIKVFDHPIATLICYELAYPQLVRQQLPLAQWIVTISDNGWFGHSLASYQQLQMAQMLSLLVGRSQILVNNDGLSSVIDTQGNVVEGLLPFSRGILQHVIYPATGATPWVVWQDYPILLFCAVCLLFMLASSIYTARFPQTIADEGKRRYP